ncbi:MAG: DUF3575 domain-containing protein [Chitinophagaceae bacterium]|nr:DUF3575 domain-containing protein [Chitinophagaceae bacterium]
MKKVSILMLLMAATLVSFAKDGDDKKGEMPAKKNAVKLNISSLAYKNIAVQYERALGPKIAVAAQIRLMPKGNLQGWSNISSGMDDNADVSVSNVKVGSFAFTPEFRFYPKRALKGFYLAPYLRLRTMSMGIDGSFKDSSTNSTRFMAIDGKMTTIGGGLMIGSHFNIGKSFSLDWFILGIHYSSSNGKLDGSITGSGMSAADQSKLQNDLYTSLEDSRFFKNNSVIVTSNSVAISTKFGMVGFRGFGLNFGYRF